MMVSNKEEEVTNLTLLAITAVYLVSFWPVAFFVPRLDLFEIVNAVCMSGSIGFCIGYASAFWQAIRMPVHKMTTPHLFVTGAWFMHFSAIQVFGLQFAWRIIGRPDWLIDSLPAAFTRWEMAGAIIIMLMTSFSQHGDLVPGTYSKLAIGISIIVFAASAFMAFLT
jgi:hypothetical protein